MRVVLPKYLGGSQSPVVVLLKVLALVLWFYERKVNEMLRGVGIEARQWHIQLLVPLVFWGIGDMWHRYWYYNIEGPRRAAAGEVDWRGNDLRSIGFDPKAAIVAAKEERERKAELNRLMLNTRPKGTVLEKAKKNDKKSKKKGKPRQIKVARPAWG